MPLLRRTIGPNSAPAKPSLYCSSLSPAFLSKVGNERRAWNREQPDIQELHVGLVNGKMVNYICLLLIGRKLAGDERELALPGLTGFDDGFLSLEDPSDLRDTLSGGGRGPGRTEREISREFGES